MDSLIVFLHFLRYSRRLRRHKQIPHRPDRRTREHGHPIGVASDEPRSDEILGILRQGQSHQHLMPTLECRRVDQLCIHKLLTHVTLFLAVAAGALAAREHTHTHDLSLVWGLLVVRCYYRNQVFGGLVFRAATDASKLNCFFDKLAFLGFRLLCLRILLLHDKLLVTRPAHSADGAGGDIDIGTHAAPPMCLRRKRETCANHFPFSTIAEPWFLWSWHKNVSLVALCRTHLAHVQVGVTRLTAEYRLFDGFVFRRVIAAIQRIIDFIERHPFFLLDHLFNIKPHVRLPPVGTHHDPFHSTLLVVVHLKDVRNLSVRSTGVRNHHVLALVENDLG
mmetsp:Transcript_29712/g.57911  ORF Transcript_29712/g.57911 Transcript_29712/m.57911 type:complete len:335 (-) Transcript_29712:2527-3531(-)